MKKLYCTICDYCRIIITYHDCKPLREWLQINGKDYCSKECQHLHDNEVEE